jgi:outer membrane receptor protein involved in Fe transport
MYVRFLPLSVFGFSLCAALSPDLACAQAAPRNGDDAMLCDTSGDACADPTTLDTIQVTATKRPESSLEIPAATTIATRAELAEVAMQTPMDALHGDVGTFVQQTTPGQGVIIVRGLKGSEVLHLVDGFRLNNAIFRNAPNQYIALVDGQSLDRIEVVRGPSSTLYGGDAMGGVVQMLTPNPTYSDGDWRWGGRLRAIAGSADDSSLGRAEINAGNDRFAFALGATSQEVNDLRVGGGDTLPFSGLTARYGDFKLGARIAEGHELVFGLQYSVQPRTPRHDALVPGFGQTQPDNAVFFFEPQQRRFAQLLWRIDTANALFDSGELRIGQQDIVDDRRTRDFGSSDEDSERNRDTSTGIAGQFGKDIGEHHHLSYGFEAYRETVESSRTRTNINTGVVTVRPPRFPNGSKMKSEAVYIADDWRIGRFDLNSGLRYSRFDVEIPAVGAAPGVRLKPDDLTGNIGLSFELAESSRLVANVGRGFRAPNIFDLGIFGPRPGNRFSQPNPDLKPESVFSVDIGLKYGGERMSGELIAFRSRYRDKITSVLTGEVMPGGALVVRNRNLTRQDLWGIEAGARYRIESPEVELYATATYTRGDERFEGTEAPADRIPPLFGKLGARWRASDRLGLEAYSLYATAQDRLSPRDALDPRINPSGTAGWATLNLRLDYRIFEDLGIALRAENLADKRFREHGSGLDEPGRNFVVSIDYRF